MGWPPRFLRGGCSKSLGGSHLPFCLPCANSAFAEAQCAYRPVKNCGSYLLHIHHVPAPHSGFSITKSVYLRAHPVKEARLVCSFYS